MRNAFIKGLLELAVDPKLMVITADLGYGLFEKFAEQFPAQYLNVGVAEQNMMGVATGLALEGYTVFTYSIGNFASFRCLEQIRNDVCYHDVNVNMVVSGGGFSYGALGMSHHATEDLSIMRALPQVTIIAPCDPWEAYHATIALANRPGAGYLRLEKSSSQFNHANGEVFEIGKSRILKDGTDITLIATGSMVTEALQSAKLLSSYDISARVISLHTIKPIDKAAIQKAALETKRIITLEENTIEGGMGSAIAEFCLENNLPLKLFYRIGMRDSFSSIVGSQQFLRQYYGLDSNAIVSKVTEYLTQKSHLV